MGLVKMDSVDFLQQVATDPDAFIAFAGEFMLASKREGQRWQVTFDVSMDQDAHPFNRYTGRATGRQGTRFKVLLVEVADDDQLVNQEHKALAKETGGNYDKLKGAAIVKESGILRNDVYFQRYLYWLLKHMEPIIRKPLLAEMPHGLFNEIKQTKGAALSDPKKAVRFANHMVHYLCSVHSCREFSYNKDAATEFSNLRQGYITWGAKLQRKGVIHEI